MIYTPVSGRSRTLFSLFFPLIFLLPRFFFLHKNHSRLRGGEWRGGGGVRLRLMRTHQIKAFDAGVEQRNKENTPRG